ncbi:hypothetical protein IAD21_04896 [Abditibacteriota bacterium]|nr:hypothetical protein IAD21_04896 [Abditibacteriota bacterium]
MAQSFFQRLLGFKEAPDTYLSQSQTEGLVLFEKDAKGSLTYRNFHRPGSSSALRRVGIRASLILTQIRLLAYEGSKPMIDVPLTDERLHQMNFTVENTETLCIAFDAALFQPTWSGQLEYRFHTPQAQRFIELLPAKSSPTHPPK